MITNVRVERNSNENTASVIRRFTKRVQGSGILRRVRRIRYYSRPASTFLEKKQKLSSLKKKEKYDEMVKLGKIEEYQSRGRGMRRK